MATFPGTIYTTIGGKIKVTQTGPTTERLLIIGTAVDGPKNTPIRYRDAAQIESIFGPANYSGGYNDPNTGTESGKPNGATIPLAVAQAVAAGCTDIWVVRATGTPATGVNLFGNHFDIEAINPGRLYNSVSFTLAASSSGATMTVKQPAIKGGDFTVVAASGTTIGQFIDTLNNHVKNTTFYIDRNAHPAFLGNDTSTLPAGVSSATLSGGTNGTNAIGEDYETSLNGYATELTATDTGTFDMIKHFRFAVAVLTGIHIDDQVVDGANATTTTIASDFAQWLDEVSAETRPCFGVIATRPTGIRSEEELIAHINDNLLSTTSGWANQDLRWTKAGWFLHEGIQRFDPIAGQVDVGMRLGVVGGPDVILTHTDVGRYTDNWHVLYAALLTTIPPEQAPIFRILPGVTGYGTSIPRKYANKMSQGVGFDEGNDLSGRGAYTILIRDPRNPGGPQVIFEDPTMASRDDFFRQYQLVHLVNSIHTDLDAVLSQFLGQPTGAPVLAAMEAAARNVLDGYAANNAFWGGPGQGYDFKITMTGMDQRLGVVRVFLEIQPATALRKIHLIVAIRRNA